MPSRQRSFRLFRIAGIDVYLHWWWFLVALYEIQGRSQYSSVVWNVVEYLALFAIVLMHEFGHALACRQVGGQANRIMLWPLGGVAYVNPPDRAGAQLWSIAAGPLVNVALLPILIGGLIAARRAGLPYASHDAYMLLRSVTYINIGLLAFNILPVYPLDGGQISRELFSRFRPRDGVEISLKLSLLVGGAAAALFFMTERRYAGLLFAMLAFESLQYLQAMRYR